MYDYAANGWQQHESGLWFKKCDDVWFYSRRDNKDIYTTALSVPTWAIDAYRNNNPAALDAAWSAELKRRESLPLLDPSKWSKTEDQGYSVHPDGYRLNLESTDLWNVYKIPNSIIRSTGSFDKAKLCCENHARALKGLPLL